MCIRDRSTIAQEFSVEPKTELERSLRFQSLEAMIVKSIPISIIGLGIMEAVRSRSSWIDAVSYTHLQNICVVANLVSDETKRKYEEAKLGYVWDIRNVLWLFEDYPELKNELISILNYSVENIEPERPEPFIFEESSQMENTDPESVADSYIAQLKVCLLYTSSTSMPLRITKNFWNGIRS